MKIVYIAHAIGGDVENNLADLRRVIRHINLNYPNVVPFAPYYADIVSMDDSIPAEQERGIKNDTAVLQYCNIKELWLTGNRISPGMKAEMELANTLSISVIDMINKI